LAVGTTSEVENVVSRFAVESGREIIAFIQSFQDHGVLPQDNNGDPSILSLMPAAAAILWTGWVTVAYTIYAQSYGQSRVRPVTANLIYTIQPVCTATFAWLLLGETLCAAGYLGGALIGSAVLLVTTQKTGEQR
jgi:drug/metabolite transporter (DMT)-like permease